MQIRNIYKYLFLSLQMKNCIRLSWWQPIPKVLMVLWWRTARRSEGDTWHRRDAFLAEGLATINNSRVGGHASRGILFTRKLRRQSSPPPWRNAMRSHPPRLAQLRQRSLSQRWNRQLTAAALSTANCGCWRRPFSPNATVLTLVTR